MSHVMVDASLHEREETLHLRELLDDVNAEVYVIRLWCYAMRTGNETGIIRLSDRALARFTEYPGAPARLRDAFVKTRFLTPVNDDPGAFYIRGWSRNEGYFADRKRRAEYMRAYRKRGTDPQPATSRDGHVTGHVNVNVTGTVPGHVTGNVPRDPSPIRSVSDPSPSLSGSIDDARANETPVVLGTLALVSSSPAAAVRDIDFRGLVRFIHDQPGVKPLTRRSKRYAEVEALAPYSQDELDLALKETRAAQGEPNGGLLAYRIIENRQAADAPPKANGKALPAAYQMSPKDADIMRSIAFARQNKLGGQS